MVIAADGAGIPSIVRVPSCVAAEVGRSLDAGAAGILFPRGDGAAMVRAAIESAKFSPAGKRGLGGVRANRYGSIPLDQFVREANERTVIVAQIETASALAEVDRAQRPHASSRRPRPVRRSALQAGLREDRPPGGGFPQGRRHHARPRRPDPRATGDRIHLLHDERPNALFGVGTRLAGRPHSLGVRREA